MKELHSLIKDESNFLAELEIVCEYWKKISSFFNSIQNLITTGMTRFV